MKSFVLRKAGKKDAKAIAIVHVNTWQNAYQGQLPADYIDSLSVEKRVQHWKNILSTGSIVLVAEQDGKIIGFCNFGPSRDKDTSSQVGEIYSIYIDPEKKGKGVGSTLMEKGLEMLREKGFSRVTLWVLDSNKKAQEFYESQGWVDDGAIKTEKKKGFEFHEIRYRRTI